MPGRVNPSGPLSACSLLSRDAWGQCLACSSASRSRAVSALVMRGHTSSFVPLRDRVASGNPQGTDLDLERNPALAISGSAPGFPSLSWRARAWPDYRNATPTHQPLSLLSGCCDPRSDHVHGCWIAISLCGPVFRIGIRAGPIRSACQRALGDRGIEFPVLRVPDHRERRHL